MKKDSELSPELRRVAREGGTEAPFTGKYLATKEKGGKRYCINSVCLELEKEKSKKAPKGF